MIDTDAILAARTDLETALRSGTDLQVLTDPAAPLTLPSVVIGPPALAYEALDSNASSARFLIYVIVTADALAVERLLELVPTVVGTVDVMTLGAPTRADPATYVSGNQQLPCYEVTVEYPL